MIYREYNGDYRGEKFKVLAGYTVKGRCGYTLVGVYAEPDGGERQRIYGACSFSTTRS